jgi:hypothetical protein
LPERGVNPSISTEGAVGIESIAVSVFPNVEIITRQLRPAGNHPPFCAGCFLLKFDQNFNRPLLTIKNVADSGPAESDVVEVQQRLAPCVGETGFRGGAS